MSGLEIAAIGSTVATLAGSAITAYSQVSSGLQEAAIIEQSAENEKARATYEAAQAEREASTSRAESQRQANRRRAEGDRVVSRQIALAAASGGAADPSIINLVGESYEEAELAAGLEIYQGETRARGLEDAAAVRLFEGEQGVQAAGTAASATRQAGFLGAGATLIGGVGSAFESFGRIQGRATDDQPPATTRRYGGGK